MKNITDFVAGALYEAGSWMNATASAAGDSNTKLSGYAQKALASTQREAGDNWDSVKDKYTKTLAAVDRVISSNLKQTAADTLKITGANMDALVAKLADMTMNLQAYGEKVGEKAAQYIEDTSGKGIQSLSPCISLMCAALQANKNGIKPADMITLINAVSK